MAVEAVSAEAVIMAAVAHATNSVAGNSGDGFILDRQKLEETACECYQVVKEEFDRLLG